MRTAHVLFMDIVGYSVLPLFEQPRVMECLRDLVLQAPEFQRAEASGQILRLPTGDGMALVFFDGPAAPLRCAIEISHALGNQNPMPVRMGIHSGPVYLVDDINAQVNVSGSGINLAQRVMDCCHAGHILLSDSAVAALGADLIRSGDLHDLGETDLKHGMQIRLFSYSTEEVGNPARPEKLLRKSASSSQSGPQRISWLDSEGQFQHMVVAGSSGTQWGRPGGPNSVRVVVLYQRGCKPDEDVARMLESHLAAHGHETFTGSGLAIGLDWAHEFRRHLANADAVVPLLSRRSIESAWLAQGLRWAWDAAGQRDGRPWRLPVRVVYTGTVPRWLEAMLGTDLASQWEGRNDDYHLVADLASILSQGIWAVSSHSRPTADLAPDLAASDDLLYVVRPADKALFTAIRQQVNLVRIEGLPGTGKTALLARGIQQARQSGWRVVGTDLSCLTPVETESGEDFFPAITRAFVEQLELGATTSDRCDPRYRPAVSFQRFLESEVLSNLLPPVLWGLDGVERLSGRGFAGELLEMLHVWSREHTDQSFRPASRLSLIACMQESNGLEAGTRCSVADLTMQQVGEMNARCGAPLCDQQLNRFYGRTAGVLRLVGRGLRDVSTGHSNADDLLAHDDSDEGPFGGLLQCLLLSVASSAESEEAARALLAGEACRAENGFRSLRGAGILSGNSPLEAEFRCPIYRSYLARHLA